ncbi:ABC transporter permease [Chitinispirillales bacterium ANBcel5]|uniref:MlaE family ABC transporter permease n=1 Tax=Cellulosispirillum alkaliphilum TaxID=3039283 RepID=UPI002A4F74C9|nr:ABC transporter permease [Chitinispirillales bacterium ANBcel5]
MNVVVSVIALFGSFLIGIAEKIGDFFRNVQKFSVLVYQTFTRAYLLYKNPGITIEHMYTLGVESFPLVSVIALFLGSATVAQAVYQMGGLIPLRYLGVLVCKSIVTELGPVITAMVVAGRVSTSIAAEVASMKSSEQLDAMNVLRLDPIRYLIVPKTVACVVMLPVLVIWANFLAIIGATFTVALSVDMTVYSFLSGLRLFFDPMDVYVGVAKTMVFGAIIALTGSHFGFQSKGGAEGVGNATTKSVVVAAVLILVFDFIIALLAL